MSKLNVNLTQKKLSVNINKTGPKGEAGNDGADGASSYTYVAYASDDQGTGFSLTPAANLTFIAVLTTDTEIDTPEASDFSGLWTEYKSDIQNFDDLTDVTITDSADGDIPTLESGVWVNTTRSNLTESVLRLNWAQVNYELFESFFTSGSGVASNVNPRAFARVDTGSTVGSYAGARTTRSQGWFTGVAQSLVDYGREFWVFVQFSLTETGDGDRRGYFFFGDEFRDIDSDPTGAGIGFTFNGDFEVSSFVHDNTQIQQSSPFVTISQNETILISIRNVGDGTVEYYSDSQLLYTENNGPTVNTVNRDVISTFVENDPSVVGRLVFNMRDLKILES